MATLLWPFLYLIYSVSSCRDSSNAPTNQSISWAWNANGGRSFNTLPCDAAAAISFYEHHPLRDEWINNWLIGYQSVRALTAHDIAILPVMIIQRRIQLLAWVGSHSETEMAQSLGESWVQETVRLCREFLEQECSELPLAV
ncbi:hypothetical protein [Vibrio tritonius]|uniref:hypothetical protein n=1 Tax=Vibrio tritonius TaxID=1435069 RepID=UPI00315CACF4